MTYAPYGYGGRGRGIWSSTTMLLILANAIVFIAMLVSGDLGDCTSAVCELLVQQNSVVLAGAYWQLFTSMFVHFGPIHLVFNMFALYYFGRMDESAFSKASFLAIYFVSGLLGSLMTVALMPADTVSGGASGAIFGLVGAYVAIARRAQHMGFALVYAVFLFIQSSVLPGVNIYAHLFGLIGGLILGLLFSQRRQSGGYSVSYSFSS